MSYVVKVQCVIGIKVETKKPLEDKKLLFNRLYVLMVSSQYTANVYTQTTDLLLFSDVVITHENV